MITQSPLTEIENSNPIDLPPGPAPTKASPPAHDENIYLIGRSNVKNYIRFVRNHGLRKADEGALADEWQAAHNYIRDTLEKTEAGLADNPPIAPLGKEYEPLLIEFLKDPLIKHGFNTVPTDVAMVELDRLVVYQKHIDLTFVRQLKEKIGPTPSDADIFRTCLPYDHPQPPIQWSRPHSDTFVFMSPSNDLRFLGTMPLKQSEITGYPPPGNLVRVIGLAVGFGSNFLNAIYAENRLILNNGSHRAYALRDLGFTHAPCIIQHVSNRAELELVAPSDVAKHPDRYLKSPRPSMLKDYFDPQLHKVIPSHRRLSQVTVKFEVDEIYVPSF